MATSSAALTLTRQAFAQLELKMPTKLEKAFRDLEQLRQKADTLPGQPSDGELGAAIAAALRAGVDPVVDEGVRKVLAVTQFVQARGSQALASYIENAFARLFEDHLDDLIDVMTPVVAEADEILAAARESVPDLDLLNPGGIGRLKPAQLRTWGEARDAIGRLERVAQVWSLLWHTSTGQAAAPHRRPLILADLTAAQLTALGNKPSAASAAHAGHRISLATRDEFTRRCDVVTDDVQEQASAADGATRNAWANSLRMRPVPTS